MDTLHSALRLRTYLVDKDGSSERFAQTIPAADVISPEVFREHAAAMRQDAERVTAALDIDLDRATFSTMAGADGWQTYTVSDVLAAAWNATIPHWCKQSCGSVWPNIWSWNFFKWILGI